MCAFSSFFLAPRLVKYPDLITKLQRSIDVPMALQASIPPGSAIDMMDVFEPKLGVEM